MAAQTHASTVACVVCDGPAFESAVRGALDGLASESLRLLVLPENVGGGGYYGHRAYAGCTHFANSEFLLYLDEDNWLEPDHVESLIECIASRRLQWAHSLRYVHDAAGTPIVPDDCESLGRWPSWQGYHLVDTSCYCVRRDVAVAIASAWHGGWGQDRVFLSALRTHFPDYDTTGRYSMNYRLGGNEGSVTAEFFVAGNKAKRRLHPGGFPWAPATRSSG